MSEGRQDKRYKLTDRQVRELIERLDAGESIRALAREYGISSTHVQRLKRRESRQGNDLQHHQ